MRFRISFAVAAVATVAAVVGGSSLAATVASSKTSPFSATYAGRAIVRATSDIAADINVTGAGKGSVVGVSKITGVGKGFSGEPCATFSGTGTITSKQGRINWTLSPGAKSCPSADNADLSAITASAKVTGGTAAFKKARGSFKITGTYDRGTGRFTSTLKGVISM